MAVSEPTSPRALRVLIVDDSATVRAAAAAALDAPDTEIHEAEDGDDAVSRAPAIDPQVILMAVQMPRMSGVDALRALKQIEGLRDVPVVMLTQADKPEDIAAALDAGAHDYLRKPFEPVELQARVAAAGRIGALSAELRRLNGELDRTARTDELTGLANRREVDRVLRAPHRKRLSLALIDIDHFEAITDTYGHEVGDVVLRTVADRLRGCLRGADVVGRWGGELFVAMLPGADAPAATIAANRLLEAVGQPLDLDHGPTHVTISIGVAVRAALDQTIDSLLAVADQALHRAKDGGRDRVVVAD